MQQNNPWFYFSTHLYKTHENEQLQNLNWNGPTRTEPLYDHTQDNFTTFNQGRQPYVLHFWVIFNLIHFPLHLPEPCQPSPDRCTLPHYFNRTEKKKKKPTLLIFWHIKRDFWLWLGWHLYNGWYSTSRWVFDSSLVLPCASQQSWKKNWKKRQNFCLLFVCLKENTVLKNSTIPFNTSFVS